MVVFRRNYFYEFMISDGCYNIFLQQVHHKYHKEFYTHYHQHNPFIWIKIFEMISIKSHFSPHQRESGIYIIRSISYEMYVQLVQTLHYHHLMINDVMKVILKVNHGIDIFQHNFII